MKDPKKIKDLISENVPLSEVMISYNVHFAYSPRNVTEVQFRCPFHGRDNKPSARLYNTTNSCYCWVCRKSWDVVSFVMEKENLSYMKAMLYIADRYKVDLSSIPDDPEFKTEKEVKVPENNVRFLHIKDTLKEFRGKLPIEKYQALCGAYLMTQFAESKGVDVTESLNKIEIKLSEVNYA